VRKKMKNQIQKMLLGVTKGPFALRVSGSFTHLVGEGGVVFGSTAADYEFLQYLLNGLHELLKDDVVDAAHAINNLASEIQSLRAENATLHSELAKVQYDLEHSCCPVAEKAPAPAPTSVPIPAKVELKPFKKSKKR
jgi:hypothetical protein